MRRTAQRDILASMRLPARAATSYTPCCGRSQEATAMAKLTQVMVAAVAAGTISVAEAQQVRVIAANPQGSIFYSASVAIGKLLDDKLQMQVRVQPMAGSSTYIPLIDRGEADFGLTNVDDSMNSFKGTGSFRQSNPSLRLIAAVFPLTLGILVPGDSPIKTMNDLRGKTLPWGYNAQTTGRVLQQAVLATAGLTMDDVRTVPTQSLFSGVDLLAEGKVDAATIAVGTAQGQRANVSLAAHGGVRFLNVDATPDALARMRKLLPARPITLQPSPANVGVVAPTTIMAYNVFFTTNARLPDDLVSNIVKVLRSGKEELIKGHPVFRGFEPGRMNEEIGVPWHPGAIKVYQEIGQWPPKS
jgi:TRAP transporter TAXI family solute receptor